MNSLSELRLLQLLNPALPVGTYSYSQGIEWACHNGWLSCEEDVLAWISDGLHGPLVQQELPLLHRLFKSAVARDTDRFTALAFEAHAYRDTFELRQEDTHRARAMVRLLSAMPDLELPKTVIPGMKMSSLAATAWPAACWQIDERALLNAFGFAWLDAQITAAVKLVPLGQTTGQRLLHQLSQTFSEYDVLTIASCSQSIGFSLPAQSMASMQHETQYSRLYRS